MAVITPVDFDPFAGKPKVAPTEAKAIVTPVDHDPFAANQPTIDPMGQSMTSGTSDMQVTGPTVESSNAGAASAKTSARASLAPDVNDQIKRYAAARFPDMPIEDAVRRYGVVDGNIVYADPNTNRYVREVPDVLPAGSDPTSFKGLADAAGTVLKHPIDTAGRVIDNLASGVGPAIPQVAGAVAGGLSAPLGWGSVPVAGAAAGITDIGRQALDRALAGEPVSNIDYLNSGGHALLAAGGQAVGVGIGKALNKNPLAIDPYDRSMALDPQQQAAAAALQQQGKDLGVDLSAGQSTGLRSLQARERQLGRYPETMDMVSDFTQNQRQVQVPNAVRGYIDDLNPNYSPGDQSVGAFKSAAEGILQSAVDDMQKTAKLAYDNALSAEPYWNGSLDALMKRPAMAQAWGRAKTIAANEGRQLPEVFSFDEAGNITGTKAIPDWWTLDYINQGLNDVLQSPANINSLTKTANSAGRAISQAKNEFLNILDKANPDYAAVRATYGQDAEALKTLVKGPVGKIADMIGKPDTSGVVNKVFNPDNFTPKDISDLRGRFLIANKGDEWNAGVANWLSDRLNDAVAGAGQTGNVPARFYKGIWGDPRQADVLKAALGGNGAQVQGLEKLMQVIQAAGKGLPEGSPTATDAFAMGPQAVIRNMPMAARVLSNIGSPSKWMEGTGVLMDAYTAMKTSPQANIKLAETLLNGDVGKQLAKLSLLSPKSQAALDVASQIITQTGITATGARRPQDFPAPVISDANAIPGQQ